MLSLRVMKKQPKTPKSLLLSTQLVRTLSDRDMKLVAGATPCPRSMSMCGLSE